MSKAITTVFIATELKTDEQFREFVEGCGPEAVDEVKTRYSRSNPAIFVLEGFEIDGEFVPLFR